MQVFKKRTSWVAAVAGLTMFASAASAVPYTERWEMNANPVTTGGALLGSLWTQDAGTSGTGITVNGDGSIKYTEPGGNSAGTFFNLGSLGASATIDFRIKVDVANNSTNTGAMMVISATGTRGLNVTANQIGFDNNPNFTGGTGVLNTGGGYKDYRLIMDGNNFTLYEGGAGGVLISSTAGGGSGANGVSNATAPFFGIGPNSGGTVTTLEFDLDYVRVVGGNSPTQVYTVPEPASLALLALSGIPMMIRRRRAA